MDARGADRRAAQRRAARKKAGAGAEPLPERHETAAERADRNLVELLQELRVLQTGVQIVFAFLLGLAFTQRFGVLDGYERAVYITTLLLTVAASALLATPVAVHRGMFHRGAKLRIVSLSTRLTSAGMVVLALALSGSVLLVVTVVLGRAAGFAAAGGSALVFLLLWFALPWRMRRTVGS